MASSGKHEVEEQGVTISIPDTKTNAEKLKIYNPTLASVREAVLCTLQIQCEDRTEALQCLDAVSNTGLACIQWKEHLGKLVHVVASEPDTLAFYGNCEQNDQVPVKWPVEDHHRPGQLPTYQQSEKEIYVCPQNGNIALHKDAFSFVYLQPNGTTSSYLDSLFTNLRHTGVACIVSPDISSQCIRSPHLIQRQYHAHVIKTDYLKEMAVRVVLGAVARAAARYNKGIEVLYAVSLADHLLLAVRVVRKQGEQTMKLCRHVLHCLMCEERVVHPDTHTVLEFPYQMLPCDCKSSNPGKTAVLLGPMWCGSIFSVPYLKHLQTRVKKTFPKSKLNSLLEVVITEAKCEGMQISRTTSRQEFQPISDAKEKDSDEAIRKAASSPANEMREHILGEPTRKKQKLENGDHHSDAETVAPQQDEISTNKSSICDENKSDAGVKSPISDFFKRTVSQDMQGQNTQEDTPLFYHDLHKKKFHATVLPKSDKLITMLRSQGFRASRTHFDLTAIRTDATIAQMMQVMKREPAKR